MPRLSVALSDEYRQKGRRRRPMEGNEHLIYTHIVTARAAHATDLPGIDKRRLRARHDKTQGQGGRALLGQHPHEIYPFCLNGSRVPRSLSADAIPLGDAPNTLKRGSLSRTEDVWFVGENFLLDACGKVSMRHAAPM